MGNNIKRITKQKWGQKEIVFKDNSYYYLKKNNEEIEYEKINVTKLKEQYFLRKNIRKMKSNETYLVKNKLLKLMDNNQELDEEGLEKQLMIYNHDIIEELDGKYLDSKIIKISNKKKQKNKEYLEKKNRKYTNNKCFEYGDKPINVRYMFKGEYELIKSRIKLLYSFEEILKDYLSCYNVSKSNKINKVNIEQSEKVEARINKNIKFFDSIAIEDIYNRNEVNIDAIYQVFNNSNNIKQNEKKIIEIFKLFLVLKIEGKKLFDNINKVLTEEKIYQIKTNYQLADIGEKDKIGVNKYLNASFKEVKKEGKVDRKGTLKVSLGEEKLKSLEEQQRVFKKVEELVEEYDASKLIKLIELNRCRDFIDLKSTVNEYYKVVYCKEEFKREPFDKVIIKYINDFAKGRYKKAKKQEVMGTKNLVKLFDGFELKLKQRIISTLYTTYINENKYKIFSNDPKKGKKMRKKSAFKEIVKAEDTLRKKVSPLISELNFMYFAQFSENQDILGMGNYQEIENAVNQSNSKQKVVFKSNISLEEVPKEMFLTKMYSAFELRNHIYHFQKLNKSELKENEKFDKRLQEYKKKEKSNLGNVFSENYIKNIKQYFKGNNIWMLESVDQTKLIKVIKGNRTVQTYLPRFNKIYNKKLNYSSTGLIKEYKISDKIFELYIDVGFNKIEQNKKVIVNNLLRYYYQQYYDYEFYNYINSKIKRYIDVVNDLVKKNKVKIKDNEKDNPLLKDFKESIETCMNLKEIKENIQKSFSNNEKQLRTMINLNNEVLAILFYDFIKDKQISNKSVSKIIETLRVTENSKKSNKYKIESMNNLICENNKEEDSRFSAIVNSVLDDRFSSHLFFISEFLDKRSVANLSNDLTKYTQFLKDLKLRYKDDQFEEIWKEVASKLLEGKYIKALSVDKYINSIDNLVILLKEIVKNIDNDRLDFEKTSKNVESYKANIRKFYGLEEERTLKFDYYITTDSRNELEKINILEKNKKIENLEKSDEVKENIKDDIVYFDFILNNIYKEKINFLREKHMEYIKGNFGDYNKVLAIYSAFRYKKEAEKEIDFNALNSVDEISKIEELNKIVEDYQKRSNTNEEFIVYIINLYQKKYKDKKDIKQINELKILINNYNFIKNLVYLKSIKNVESFIHQIHSRMNVVYRTIERDYTYLHKYNKDKGMFDVEMDKVYEMLNLNNFLSEKLVNNINDESDQLKNKKKQEIIKKFRNDVAHKNIFQLEKNKNLNNYNKSILNEYNRGTQVTKYDTKLNKSIFEVYKKSFDKSNIVCQAIFNGDVPKFTYSVKELNYDKNNKAATFKLMSEMEKDYIVHFINF